MLDSALKGEGREEGGREEARRRNEPAESPPEVKTASFRGTLSRLAGAKSSDAGTGIVGSFRVVVWLVRGMGGGRGEPKAKEDGVGESKVQLLLVGRLKRQLVNKK